MRILPNTFIALALLAAPMLTPAAALAAAAEQPVDPYVQSPANAGAVPFKSDGLYKALHEQAGIERIVAGLIKRNVTDPRISDIFKASDLVRLQRTLVEQVCYIAGGPCTYTGRDMKAAHKDMGLQMADMNALVENLQLAMDGEKVSFRAQNQLLSKLAPMRHDVVER